MTMTAVTFEMYFEFLLLKEQAIYFEAEWESKIATKATSLIIYFELVPIGNPKLPSRPSVWKSIFHFRPWTEIPTDLYLDRKYRVDGCHFEYLFHNYSLKQKTSWHETSLGVYRKLIDKNDR